MTRDGDVTRSWYFHWLTRYAADAGEGWSLTLPRYFPFTAPRDDGERRIVWIERRRELPRAGLFVVAFALSIASALVLTGAIVSTVYTVRVARFAAMEVFDYGREQVFGRSRGDSHAAAAVIRQPRVAQHSGRASLRSAGTVAAGTRAIARPRHATKARV